MQPPTPRGHQERQSSRGSSSATVNLSPSSEEDAPGTKDDDFDFASLSLKDLIEARDLYHFHLMNKANVVGTAVGLYLIRTKQEWPQRPGGGQ
jgi:hypothetical protein